MATYIHTNHDSLGGSTWGRRYKRLVLAGHEVFYLFLSPDMVFYKYLLSEANRRPSQFLTAGEQEILREFKVEKRRIEWLAGRLNTKLLLSKYIGRGYDFLNFEILPGPNGRPVATMKLNEVMQVPLKNGLSLSHREGASASAISAGTGVKLGIDVEMMESRSELMLEDYFKENEIAILSKLPSDISAYGIALAWSIKESVLKAMQVGLSVPATSAVIEKMNVRSSAAEVSFDDGTTTCKLMCRFILQPPYIITLSSI